MSENVTVLTPKQLRAIIALIAHPSIPAAAAAADVDVRTLYRWLEQTPFCLVLFQKLDQVLNAATLRLVRLTEKAITFLESLLDDPIAHPSIKIRAAEMILIHSQKLFELRIYGQRLTALEEHVAKQSG